MNIQFMKMAKETTYEINREQHLEEIMKWAVQELNNNFELEEIK